ncbi:hypothetical protein JOS77_13120 [Chromobacterium haemolyticum]|nr:hypothetical protein JOS77_13120 [Chromobacterium haemolyticum]
MSGGAPTALGQWFDQLKEQIDLHDLAARLGLKRQGKGNYHSPHHPDSHASLSIFADGRGWKDWSGDAGGSCIDLLRYCQPELDTPLAAARLLGDWYGLPQPKPAMKDKAAPVRKSTLDYIGERCLAQADAAIAYLVDRGIDEAVIRRALRCKTLGWKIGTAPRSPPAKWVMAARPSPSWCAAAAGWRRWICAMSIRL